MTSSSASSEDESPPPRKEKERPKRRPRSSSYKRTRSVSRPRSSAISPTSIEPVLKLTSFDDDRNARCRPQPPKPTDVILVPIPVLPKRPEPEEPEEPVEPEIEEPDEASILKRILKEINELEALRLRHRDEAKEKEKDFYRREMEREGVRSSTPTASLSTPRSEIDSALSPGRPRSDNDRRYQTLQSQLEAALNPVEGITFHPHGGPITVRRPDSAKQISPRPQSIVSSPTSPAPLPSYVLPPPYPPPAPVTHVPYSYQATPAENASAINRRSRMQRWRRGSGNPSRPGHHPDPLGVYQSSAPTPKPPMERSAEVPNAEQHRPSNAQVPSDPLSPSPNGENRVSAKEKAMFQQLMDQRRQMQYPSLGELLQQEKQPKKTKSRKKKDDLVPEITLPSKSASRKDDLWNRFQSSLQTSVEDLPAAPLTGGWTSDAAKKAERKELLDPTNSSRSKASSSSGSARTDKKTGDSSSSLSVKSGKQKKGKTKRKENKVVLTDDGNTSGGDFTFYR